MPVVGTFVPMTFIAFPGHAISGLRSSWTLLGWRLVARIKEVTLQ